MRYLKRNLLPTASAGQLPGGLRDVEQMIAQLNELEDGKSDGTE